LIGSEELAALFADFQRTAFRLETLPQYRVEGEEEAFRLFLAGASIPDAMKDREWLRNIRHTTASGKTWRRVHAISGPLTPYLRFEMEWGYVYSQDAGEDIRILHEEDDPNRHFEGLPFEDFWLFDDRLVVRMCYDAEGRYLGAAEPIDDTAAVEGYRATRDAAWARAVPFDRYRNEKRSQSA
jgi:hypothetical protein